MRDAETGEQLLVDTHDTGFRQRFARIAAERETVLRHSLAPEGTGLGCGAGLVKHWGRSGLVKFWGRGCGLWAHPLRAARGGGGGAGAAPCTETAQ